MSFADYAVPFVLLLGGLIFFHELGHFAVAKWLGVKVERFSIGFGPSIIHKRFGETEYRLAWLPLGGYVRMLGALPGDELTPDRKAMGSTLGGHAGGPADELAVAVPPPVLVVLKHQRRPLDGGRFLHALCTW